MTVLYFFIFITAAAAKDMKLLEVFALSRHNIRTPFEVYIQKYTPKTWPTFEESPGYLTRKGAKMETYMGRYFYEWLTKEDLLTDGCSDDVFIYANCIQRTVETAKSFVQGAFPNCNVPVHYRNDTAWDPIFDAVIKNGDQKYIKDVIQEMEGKVNSIDSDFKPVYELINEILDLEDSYICKKYLYCDFTNDKSDIIFEFGQTHDVRGPIFIVNTIVDVFIMSFYDGKPMEDVAWGLIRKPEDWKLLSKIVREYQNLRFNLTTASKDFAEPLLQKMADIFLGDLKRKFTLIVGHDANINCLTTALGFKPFALPYQYEPFPVGGKVVFQKWTDGLKDFLKVEYFYQSWEKLRHGSVISLEDPPLKYTMEMKDCPIDKDGFCQWDDFVELLKNTLERFE